MTDIEQLRPNIGLDDRGIKTSGDEFVYLYSDLKLLFIKGTEFHFNAVGPRAYMLHHLFKDIVAELLVISDTVGKHIRGLGSRVPNVTEIVKMARIETTKQGDCPGPDEQIKILLQDFERIMNTLNDSQKKVKSVKDDTSEDLILDIQMKLRVLSFKLRMHLNKESGGGRP